MWCLLSRARSPREGQHSALGSLGNHFRGPNVSFSWCFKITHLEPIIMYFLLSWTVLEVFLALFIVLPWFQQEEDPISVPKAIIHLSLPLCLDNCLLCTVGMQVRKRSFLCLAKNIPKEKIFPSPFIKCIWTTRNSNKNSLYTATVKCVA